MNTKDNELLIQKQTIKTSLIPNQFKDNDKDNIIVDTNKNNQISSKELNKSTHSKHTLNYSKESTYSIEEWNTLFSFNTPENANQLKLLNSLKLGIPKSIRGKAWLFLSKGYQLSLSYAPSMFDNCLSIKNETAEMAIQKDISRTYLYGDSQTSKLTVSEPKLYNILKAFSIYDYEVSYCQGINYIVATFLQCIGNEKYVFWLLVQLMNQFNWRDLYKSNTPKLLRMIDILKQKFKLALPDLFAHFSDNSNIEILQFVSTHFFLTLFCYNTPIELSLRVIDLFWVYEEKIIFDVIISLLSLQKEKLLQMNNEELLLYLKSDLVFDLVNEYGVDTIINYVP